MWSHASRIGTAALIIYVVVANCTCTAARFFLMRSSSTRPYMLRTVQMVRIDHLFTTAKYHTPSNPFHHVPRRRPGLGARGSRRSHHRPAGAGGDGSRFPLDPRGGAARLPLCLQLFLTRPPR